MNALRFFLGFLLRILVFSLVLAGVHYLLTQLTALTPEVSTVFKIHVFVVAVTVLSFAVLVMIGRIDHSKIGFTFLGLVILKMMVSFAFLYPYLIDTMVNTNILVFNFFIVYFLFLAWEVREVYLLIGKGARLNG